MATLPQYASVFAIVIILALLGTAFGVLFHLKVAKKPEAFYNGAPGVHVYVFRRRGRRTAKFWLGEPQGDLVQTFTQRGTFPVPNLRGSRDLFVEAGPGWKATLERANGNTAEWVSNGGKTGVHSIGREGWHIARIHVE